MDDYQMQDICRFCRGGAAPNAPLYYPCVCSGSMKYIHKECLLQWIHYKGNQNCEICNYRYRFRPIYSPDMPRRVPLKYILTELLRSLGTAVQIILVAVLWLEVVPLTAFRMCRCIFQGSSNAISTLPFDILSKESIFPDILYGYFVLTFTLCALRCVLWLIEDILDGEGPDWFEEEEDDLYNMMHPSVGFANNHGGQVAFGNWNPEHWYEALEDVTLEELLGLDGSLFFLEHICWVLYLNALFTVVFAFFPYYIGQFSISSFGFKQLTSAPELEFLLTILFGYVNIGIVLALLHGAAAIIKLRKMRRLLGICYLVVKVSLFLVWGMGIFPLISGWLLDICSLNLLGATINDRHAGFRLAPVTSLFTRWLAGELYLFLASVLLISILREVLRPGVLWFLYDFNLNPIQKMLRYSILKRFLSMISNLLIHGTAILLIVWFPVSIIETIAPSFLPCHVMLSSELSYSLLILLPQAVVLLFAFQGHHMKLRLECLVRTWCTGVSYILDIRSYLLGDVNTDEQQPNVAAAPVEHGFQNGAVGAAGDPFGFQNGAVGAVGVPFGFQPYRRPRFLPFKIVCLIFFICISLTLSGLVLITVPVFAGRKLMSLCLGYPEVNDLCTIVCGLYIYWIIFQIGALLWSWIPKSWNTISSEMKEWLEISFKILCSTSVLLGLIPILLGLLLDLILFVPFSVSLNHTPLISMWQDWVLGTVYAVNIFYAVVFIGPNCRMRSVMVQVYSDGICNINSRLIFVDLTLPVIIFLGLSLTVPYITACSTIPMFPSSFELQNLVLRIIYPALFAFCMTVGAVVFLNHQFSCFYERIKQQKYLVGTTLVNYEGRVRA